MKFIGKNWYYNFNHISFFFVEILAIDFPFFLMYDNKRRVHPFDATKTHFFYYYI